MSEKPHSIVTEKVAVEFRFREGELVGIVYDRDLAILCAKEPEKECTIKILPHENWAGDAWVNSETDLDVPCPRTWETWVCRLRRLWYKKGVAVWVAMPVRFLSQS